MDSTDLRCPDCGAYWPMHFKRGRPVGCLKTIATIVRAREPDAVSIRRGISGSVRGHTLICFRDCQTPGPTGSILVLNLDTETYEEFQNSRLQDSSVRLKGLELERAKDRVEDWLSYSVRIVGR